MYIGISASIHRTTRTLRRTRVAFGKIKATHIACHGFIHTLIKFCRLDHGLCELAQGLCWIICASITAVDGQGG